MKVNGIIAEYNPFHNGHRYHLEESARRTGADYTIVVMSGDFVQRGAPAMLDKHTRAEMALRCGADLVLELPVLYAASSAEYFAAGAVALLDKLGTVTHLCFGSECGDAPLFLETARLLTRESAPYRQALKDRLRRGASYPDARAEALVQCYPSLERHRGLLSSPNSILGLEYCKALIRRGSSMEPVPIRRLGAGYHDGCCGPDGSGGSLDGSCGGLDGPDSSGGGLGGSYGNLDDPDSEPDSSGGGLDGSGSGPDGSGGSSQPGGPDSPGTAAEFMCSALALRQALCAGKTPEQLSRFIPVEAFGPLCARLSQRSAPVRPDDFSALLYYKLILEREQGYQSYLDVSENLSNRILGSLNRFAGFDAFCALLKSRELTYTRISRSLLHILLGLKNDLMSAAKALDYVPYARVLGLRRDSSALPAAIKRQSSIPLITRLKDAQKSLGGDALRLLRQDILCGEIYRCAAWPGQTAVSEYSLPPVIL